MTEEFAQGPKMGAFSSSRQDVASQEPGLVDGLRFLYQRRARLTVCFVIFLGIGIIGFLYSRITAPTIVKGTLSLGFQGIERGEYPSGKRFSVEDFRGPDLLAKALGDAGIGKEAMDIRQLASEVMVIPVIPDDVQARWKVQEKNGVKKEEYSPNEFDISLQSAVLNDAQRFRLFDAIVKRYQERIRYEQKAALNFAGSFDSSFEQLTAHYDLWDIPTLFQDTYRSLSEQLLKVISESLQYPDSKYHLAFRNLSKELSIWSAARLSALEAVTFQGKLVKNREVMLQRIEYRIADIDIKIKQATQEASQAERLLSIIEHPKAILAGQLSGKEGTPLVDTGALDRLIKSDYVGPLVDRISQLQQQAEAMEAEKSRLQKQLAWLPKVDTIDLAHPPLGYKDLLQNVSSELDSIIQNYNRLLDEYLTASITSLVVVKQSPIVNRPGYSSVLVMSGIVLMSLFLAVFMISVEHLFRRAKRLAQDVVGQGPEV